MTKARLSASMCVDIPDEREFVEQWKRCLPRRRQQWLREIISLAIAESEYLLPYKKEPLTSTSSDQSAPIRVQVELDLRDSRDADIHKLYSQGTTYRRGQWLREVLVRGSALQVKKISAIDLRPLAGQQ